MMNSAQYSEDTVATIARSQCTILIESDVVMVSRKIPEELLVEVGFIEWNRFCDRLDVCLEPLRILAEQENKGPGRSFKEQAAKTTALQSIQEACDKLSQHNRSLDFMLYCPFHGDLVSNWHIQVTYVPGSLASREESIQADAATDSLQISHQVSDETSDMTDGSAIAPRQDETQDAETAVADTDAAESGETDGNEGAQSPEERQDDDNNANPQDTLESPSAASFQRHSGIGILGKDYIEHEVQPTDTVKGLCLKYNISAVRLRQANLLSGETDSLLLAPKVLAIPISEGFYSRVQDTDSQDYKLNALKKKFPKLGTKEAKAYLELSDWVLEDALATAREDIQWEKETKDDFF